MLEPELVRGSPTRTGGDRGLAGGLQHRAPAQLAKVSDAGRVRRECRRATGVSPQRGQVRMCRSPGVLTYDWTKNGGQVKAVSLKFKFLAQLFQNKNQIVC